MILLFVSIRCSANVFFPAAVKTILVIEPRYLKVFLADYALLIPLIANVHLIYRFTIHHLPEGVLVQSFHRH
jgi:hypothetical protein